MINFFNQENRNAVINTGLGNDWPVVAHVSLYTNFFDTWNTQYNGMFADLDAYIADTNNNGTCTNESIYLLFRTEFQDKMPELFLEVTKEASTIPEPDPTRLTSIPAFNTPSGLFGNLVKVLDVGSESFMNNYSMAKQLQKYECSYLELFRFLIQLQGEIKSGNIMGYFDNIYKEFKEGVESFFYYIQTDTSTNPPTNRDYCQKMDAIAHGYYNSYTYDGIDYPSFDSVFRDYKYKLEIGFDDLDTLLTAFNGFYDELYLGVKIISCINMVFYSDPQDADMIRSEGASNFSFLAMDMESANDSPTQQLQARTLYSLSLVVPMTLDSMAYIDETKSNINTILSQLIHNALSALNIQMKLNAMKDVLDTQGS